MVANIIKIFETCKLFWPASEDFVNFATVFVNFATVFVNSATVFVNSATPRGHAPAAPQSSFSFCSARKMLFCKKSQNICPFLWRREKN